MSKSNKFRIREGNRLAVVNEPNDFRQSLEPLPAGCKFVRSATEADQLHWFVQNQQQLRKEIAGILKTLKPDMLLWVYYPKGSSGLQTDLTRDKGWEPLLKKENKLQWLTLVSLNNIWSGFALRKTDAKQPAKKTATPKERAVFQYADPVTRKVSMPPVLKPVFEKNKKAFVIFDKLTFTHKKEYIEWILEAAKEETRQRRIEKMLGMLLEKAKADKN